MADGLTLFTLLFVILPLVAALSLGLAPMVPPISDWGTTNHAQFRWVIFLSAWFLSWISFAGIFARLVYAISFFYFDTTFGLVAGITRTIVQSNAWNLLIELWLRQLLGWLAPPNCFATDGMTCQLAAGAVRIGSLGITPAFLAIFPALLSLLVARWIVTRRYRQAHKGVDSHA